MSSAATAAAAIAAQMAREEQEMTPYSPSDLAEGWEFKILRSGTSRFRDPAKLRAALDEEARGGWVLVEKFDNCRIRLKRPASAKAVQGDFADDYDPYRTTVGSSRGVVVMITLVGLALGILGLIMTLHLIRGNR